MSLSMYQASVPVLIRQLTNLSAVLTKGEAYAAGKKIDASVLVNARLAPDMFPLARQVQIASDNAKGCAARLAGVEVPSYADTETTFAELQGRITKTVEFLQSIKPQQIDGSEDRDITIKNPHMERHFKGQQYLFDWALPNVFFHVTTAYAILRHNGADLGKMDFLGNVQN